MKLKTFSQLNAERAVRRARPIKKNKKRISLQAPKRVGPPIKNQGSSASSLKYCLDRLQALGYYKIMKKKYYLLDYFICDEKDLATRQAYVKECEKFFKQLKVKNVKKRSK